MPLFVKYQVPRLGFVVESGENCGRLKTFERWRHGDEFHRQISNMWWLAASQTVFSWDDL